MPRKYWILTLILAPAVTLLLVAVLTGRFPLMGVALMVISFGWAFQGRYLSFIGTFVWGAAMMLHMMIPPGYGASRLALSGLGSAGYLACLVIDYRMRGRQETRAREHLCLVCGYDLRATPKRCPECGWEVPLVIDCAYCSKPMYASLARCPSCLIANERQVTSSQA